MSADSFDGFDYELDSREPSEEERRRYWAVAIGLQEVDGLEVSPYLRELARAYEQGQATLRDTGDQLRHYHDRDGASDNREADLVSQRIAELLSAGSFVLAPDMLAHIHGYLFQDLDQDVYRPGQFKTDRLVKQEDILNGDSVLYADPSMIDMSLNYLFREENLAVYGTEFGDADVERLCAFFAHIWQVHPFVEGNTRTTAVFSELYLRNLGFSTSNDPFETHARYFRDALVRANYRNNAAGVQPDFSYLETFYRNLLLDEGNMLDRQQLICLPLFENPELLKNIDPARALRR